MADEADLKVILGECENQGQATWPWSLADSIHIHWCTHQGHRS